MNYNFLILDYNRPKESELCLKSIKRFAKFNYSIVYLSNSGEQEYVYSYYKENLIDKLILRKDNSGCGLGTRELFNNFDLDSDFVFYIQCDQFMIRDLFEEEVVSYINAIQENVLYIDLASNQGHGQYSERAHFINKNTYNKIPNTIGGPGPFANNKWTEESIQDYMKKNDLTFITVNPPVFQDNGKISYRQFPCGGETMHFTDTKQLWILKPLKQKYPNWPNIELTDEEWSLVLNNKWHNGTIPDKLKQHSFNYWKDIYNLDSIKI
jgi:hypothetical protein